MKKILDIIKMVDLARDKIKEHHLYDKPLNLWYDLYDGILYDIILELQKYGLKIDGEEIMYLPEDPDKINSSTSHNTDNNSDCIH